MRPAESGARVEVVLRAKAKIAANLLLFFLPFVTPKHAQVDMHTAATHNGHMLVWDLMVLEKGAL